LYIRHRGCPRKRHCHSETECGDRPLHGAQAYHRSRRD
jgi:hypothetical protein